MSSPIATMARLAPLLLAALGPVAAWGGERQLIEGTIAFVRFAGRIEVVSSFLIQEPGAAGRFVPLQVAEGKRLTIRQVTATCTLSSSAEYGWMNFWSIRSSPDTAVHHYLPIRAASRNYGAAWVANERVEIPVRAGGRPVANFQRSLSGGTSDACVGSWSGILEDA